MNILLVDDDKLFIRKTVEGIDWENIGIHQIFTAGNMDEACRVLETFRVDIVVTDVEMPQGSGLELLEWIAEKKYQVESIVISGYAHFAYAQKAMEFGSRKYILKPVSSKELMIVIGEIVREKQEKLAEEKKRSEHVLPKILGDGKDEQDFLDEMKKTGEACREDIFQIVLLRILSEEKEEYTERKLLSYAVQNIVREFFEESELDLKIVGQDSGGEWLFLIHIKERDFSVSGDIVKIQSQLERMIRVISCAYVDRNGKIEEIIQTYPEFRRKCQEIVAKEQRIIFTENWELEERVLTEDDLKGLSKALSGGDFVSVKKRVTQYVDGLVEEHCATKHNFESLLDELVQLAYHFLKEMHVTFEQIFEEEEFARRKHKAVMNVPWMYDFIDYLMETLEGKGRLSESKKESLDYTLKQYIDEHLDEDLSRKKLASLIHFSEDYIARMFRSQTGQSISGYVMEQRMERAKRYLTETDKSISEIALLVGYSNFSYFSKSFKDYVGKVPNEYRMYNKKKKN